MKYFVEEIQTFANGTVAHLPSFGPYDEPEAEQKYHTCLAAAAVSELPCHAVAMLDSEARLIKREKYVHREEQENG